AARPLPISDEGDGINLQEEGRCTAPWSRFRVEDVRFAHRQLSGLQPTRILVEQVSEIGRRLVSRGDGEEHQLATEQQQQRPIISAALQGPPGGNRLVYRSESRLVRLGHHPIPAIARVWSLARAPLKPPDADPSKHG